MLQHIQNGRNEDVMWPLLMQGLCKRNYIGYAYIVNESLLGIPVVKSL